MCQKKKKRDNLEEMDKFAEMYNLLRPNMEETGNLNRSINSSNLIKKYLPANTSPGSDSLTCEFYQTFREEPTPVFSKLFKKPGEERVFLNSFYDASITSIPKSDKDMKKRKLHTSIIDEHSYKNYQQNISKTNSRIH